MSYFQSLFFYVLIFLSSCQLAHTSPSPEDIKEKLGVGKKVEWIFERIDGCHLTGVKNDDCKKSCGETYKFITQNKVTKSCSDDNSEVELSWDIVQNKYGENIIEFVNAKQDKYFHEIRMYENGCLMTLLIASGDRTKSSGTWVFKKDPKNGCQ